MAAWNTLYKIIDAFNTGQNKQAYLVLLAGIEIETKQSLFDMNIKFVSEWFKNWRIQSFEDGIQDEM